MSHTVTLIPGDSLGDELVPVVKRVMEGVGVEIHWETAAAGRQAYEATAPGGTTVVVGMAPEDDDVSFNALSLPRTEKVIMGSWYGSARPWADFPRLVNLYMANRLSIDPMISRTYRLEEINEAYEALDKGEMARSVILFD